MLTYVTARSRKKPEPGRAEFAIPFDLRRRVLEWIDVDEVGPDGFWLWLRAVVPLLPRPGAEGRGPRLPGYGGAEELQDLRRRLVFYAREHARLSVITEQYARDNQTLSRRLRALESALRTLESAGHRIEIPPDENATALVERHLPPKTRRSWRGDPSSRPR